MKRISFLCIALMLILTSFKNDGRHNLKTGQQAFNTEKDLILAQFDCKTDIDDLHSVAAFVTLMSYSDFSTVKYYAVAGTYGIQDGLYVPPNDLFQLAFGDKWADAHSNIEQAVKQVKAVAETIFADEGDIWIAEAGQSDFSALLIKAVQKDLPGINTSKRIHIVQHSNWNEEVTSPDALQFVKQNTDYIKIPDGNVVGNGTPGFRTPEYNTWISKIKDMYLKKMWALATDLGNLYNGKDGRYNNEAVKSGGLDFSDLSETCRILGITDLKDTEQFFERYGQ